MNNRKTMIRFFTIADYEDEEIWLRNQHQNGYKLVRTIIPCFYIFEECTPEDVVYRLDYKNNSENGDYFQIYKDYGWEYFNRCVGWLYFRKPVSETDSEQDYEIFSDDKSRVDMVDHIIKTRMLPIMIIFLTCVLPNFIRYIGFENVVTVIFSIIMLLYIYLIIHCGLKLRKLRKKYSND